MKVLRVLCATAIALCSSHAWADCKLKDYGTLPVDMENGRATTVVKINGTDTPMQLDSGAFFSIMSKATALSLGLKPRPAPIDFRISGIGGSANAQITHIKEFGILGTSLHDVDFIVAGTDVGYALVGANLIDVEDVELDLAHGKVTLFKADDCGDSVLAYWVNQGGSYNVADIESVYNRSDRRTFIKVTVNGKPMRALLDSGASATVLTRDAAERAGIDLKAPDVKTGESYGVGFNKVKSWTARVESFTVGTELIQHTQMEVIDTDLGDGHTDMLLGVDFILAHHMFIANTQQKAYFTYNGGRVFTFGKAPVEASKPASASTTAAEGAAPMAASDYALRGEADLSRGEVQAALADLNDAIRLAPDHAEYYVSRAKAYMSQRQSDEALADLTKALSLDPKNVDALLMRARIHFAHRDRPAAAIDVNAATRLVIAGSPQARALASMNIDLGQPAAALPLLDDWIRMHGSDAWLGAALNERCWARSLSNQMLDDALSDCRKAIRHDGENPAYLDSLGLVQLRLGNYPDAIKTYEQALAANPHLAWSRYGLGLAKIRSGQVAAGQADVLAARTLDPGIADLAAKYGLVAPQP